MKLKNYLFCFLFVFSNIISAQTNINSDSVVNSAAAIPDYSNINNWAAHPWKKDYADSVPAPLRKDYHSDSSVDIFFIHPTSYIESGKKDGWNASINNEAVNKHTDERSILYQATIFNEAGRVFAPRYRQAHLSAYYTASKDSAMAAFDLAYEDVKAAFEYYLEHYNNGRPIIIASHSQGTTHAKRLIKEFFDGKPLQNQLVAAYLVGMAVEPDYFTSIQPCATPEQTGCICSWRTYKEDFEPPYVQKEGFMAIVTNPLTWSTTEPVATRTDNEGAVLMNFNKLLPGIAGASVHNGVLWVEKPHFFGNVLYTTKNYHIIDYNLFYMNVRENVKQRTEAFEKNLLQ